ncbi:MAG: class I SAM-dependent methyltransferase [Promethearchaeota archaeon]
MLNEQRHELHKQAVSKAFGAIAPFYDSWYESPLGRYVWLVETAAIEALMPVHIIGVCVEIGIGTGMALDILKPVSSTIVAVDISWQMLTLAYRKIQADPLVHLALADGENLPFRQNVMSLAFGMTVLEFVPNPKKILSEVYRCLHPAGWLVLGILTSTNVWALERRIRNLVAPDVFSYARFSSPWQITRMLHQSGFSIVKSRGSVYAPSFTPQGWLSKFAQLDEVLGTRALTRSLGAFFCVQARRSSSR